MASGSCRLERGPLAISRHFVCGKVQVEMIAGDPMVNGNLDRLATAGTDHAAVRRFVVILQRRNDDGRSHAKSIRRQIQGSIEFDKREQMATAQASLMVFNDQIQNCLAAQLGRFPGAQLAAFGQILRLGRGLQIQPTIESVEVVLLRNESPPGLFSGGPRPGFARLQHASAGAPKIPRSLFVAGSASTGSIP